MLLDPTLGWGESEEYPTPDFDILGAPSDGTFAEQVVVPADNVAAKPARLSWEEAAALNLGGLTAWRAAVSCAGAGRGAQSSSPAPEVASRRSRSRSQPRAERACSSPRPTEAKLARARLLGAEGGTSYLDPGWPERIRELAGGDLDAAIDSHGGASWEGALRTLRRGGTLVSFGDTSGPETTLTTAEVYWEWRRVLGTSMGSPREYRAMLAHVEKRVVESGDRQRVPARSDRRGRAAAQLGRALWKGGALDPAMTPMETSPTLIARQP